MFTGLVAEVGSVEEVRRGAEGGRVTIAAALADELAPGDSVAVNGVCLTAAEVGGGRFGADVMPATLSRSAALAPGGRVNLELPLRAGDRLGGHVVQGHVDGVGTVLEVRPDGLARRVAVEAEPELLRYVVEAGSIAVDGVSLTVAELDGSRFEVSLIPETLARTSLAHLRSGARVNLEVDVLAKYVERLVAR